MELRRNGHGLYPLEGSTYPPAGLPHNDQRSDVSHFHQIPPRLDNLGRTRNHGHMGYVKVHIFKG